MLNHNGSTTRIYMILYKGGIRTFQIVICENQEKIMLFGSVCHKEIVCCSIIRTSPECGRHHPHVESV